MITPPCVTLRTTKCPFFFWGDQIAFSHENTLTMLPCSDLGEVTHIVVHMLGRGGTPGKHGATPGKDGALKVVNQ